MNVLEVKKDALREMIAEVVPWNYLAKENENVFTAYIWGDIPIKVRSSLTQKEFSNLCGDDVY